MIIRRIHISAFGPLKNFDCELYSGMNVIRGDNESGKTSLAMFIKFIFYGLSGRSIDGEPSERKKYVNWDTGTAEGYVIVGHEGKEYRIERTLSVSVRAGSDKESVREALTVTDTATGGRVPEFEEAPGTEFFGVTEQVFINTVFSGQSGRSRIDGSDTAAAVENMLFSADETINVKKAAERLDKYRRTLLHKKGGGGEIPQLKEKCTDLRSRLDAASADQAQIIELEGAVALQTTAESELISAIDDYGAALKYFEAEKLCAEGDEAKLADKAAESAESDLRGALALCCEPSKLDIGRRLSTAIEGERASEAEFSERLYELEVGAANLSDPAAPADPVELLNEYRKCTSTARTFTVMGVISAVLGLAAGGAAALMYAMKNQFYLVLLGVAAILLVLCGVFFILRGKKSSRMNGICDIFEADDESGIASEVEYILSRRAEADALMVRAESVRLSLEQSRQRIEALETEAMALAASFEDCCKADYDGGAINDAAERLSSAITLGERRLVAAEGLRAAYETAAAVATAKWERIPKDKLASAAEHIRSTPRKEGFPSDEEGADTARRNLSFNQAKLDALRKKLHAEEVELAAKKAVTESPATLWEELTESLEKLKLLNLRYEAVTLAEETLTMAGENIRRGVIPKVVKLASSYFSAATEGRYEKLGAGNAFELTAVAGGHTRDSKFLSSGTEDLAYVCLRVALATELFGDKKPPLIFDESLAFMDPGRSAAAKDILAASGHQVLLFTCKPENTVDIFMNRPV